MRAGAEVHEVKATRKALVAGLALSVAVTLLLAVSAPILVAHAALGLGAAAVVLALAAGLVATVLVDRVMTPVGMRADELELAA